MKQTNARIKRIADIEGQDGRPMAGLSLYFEISEEDLEIIEKTIRPTMPTYEGKEADTADAMTALITWATHRLYEEITGQKFTLHMDRAKA